MCLRRKTGGTAESAPKLSYLLEVCEMGMGRDNTKHREGG